MDTIQKVYAKGEPVRNLKGDEGVVIKQNGRALEVYYGCYGDSLPETIDQVYSIYYETGRLLQIAFQTELEDGLEITLTDGEAATLDMDKALSFKRRQTRVEGGFGTTYLSVVETINNKKEYLGFKKLD